MPKISVIMPTKNAGKYIAEAIDSILDQTFSDFEFLIIDDASTDNTLDIIRSYHDKRIKLINGTQKGLSAALNLGISLAQGEYIARMDADDISLPTRFEKQADYLDAHPEISLLGTWQEHFGRKHGFHKPSSNPDIAKMALIFTCDFCHSTAMFRRDVFIQNNLFYPENSPIEDYELWSKAIEFINVSNIPEVLGKYRIHNQSVTTQKVDILGEYDTKIVYHNLKYYFNIDCSCPNFLLKSRREQNYKEMKKNKKIEYQKQLDSLFHKIKSKNAISKFIKDINIDEAIAYCWYLFCRYDNFIQSNFAPKKIEKNVYVGKLSFQPITKNLYFNFLGLIKIKIKQLNLYNFLKMKLMKITDN